MHSRDILHYYYYTPFLSRGKVRPADKLQLKAAIILPLVGLARSKQDPVNRVHGAQYLYRPPPAGANQEICACSITAWVVGWVLVELNCLDGRLELFGM